ncbi:3-oxoacyl-[acyl-carrier protein] reductase [Motilibacter peucedani]|uniref:3-oxoacyl-[acyl-carrier protein] reductase n=1 Tax=Motilibacter peucedani TaxID=598650 RepID=A0A420XRJ9_9ACTN|nr:SDR family NAD(P)-dependent oxidoreductase [Motilibacter peucedani]RKS77439.1 3-oxoacyl-[acyl-carrier protein] reductase [Motilibacter peucedani]
MTTSVEGQTAVVVGAGSGIGRATALLLAERGAHVVCVDRLEQVADTVAQARDAGGSASALIADVTEPATVVDAFARAAAERGQLHAVVNTAGITGPQGRRSHEVDVAELDRTYAVNLRGAYVVSQEAVRHMLPHGYGRIAHVASIAGKEGNPGMIGYSTTKAGLIGMVKAQGKEYALDGITVNALAPAVIQTPFLDDQPAETLAYMAAKIPMGRFGTMQEAAELLAWMASPACSFTTGFTFDLSGGRATY